MVDRGAVPALPAPMRMFGIDRGQALQTAIFVLTIALVAAPLLPLLYQSVIDRPLHEAGKLLSLDNYAALFRNQGFRDALVNTALFAAGSTAIAQVVGLVGAILVGRTDMPGRTLFGTILLWPMFISSLVLALGWFLVYGSAGFVSQLARSNLGLVPWNLYSIGGMALVSGVVHAPLAMLYCLGATNRADPSLEDAARSCGAGPARTLWSITVPLMLPAFLYSSVLNLTLALETLSIPLILGEPVGKTLLSTFLYAQMNVVGRPNYGLVSSAAVLLLVVVAILVFLQGLLLRNSERFVTIGGKASRPRPIALGALRWPACIALALYNLMFVVLPMLFLGIRASVSYLTPGLPFWNVLTIDNFTVLFSVPAYLRAIGNTFVIGIVGGGIATIYVTLVALVANRSDFPLRKPLRYASMAPRAIPGMIAGLGFFYALLLLPLGELRSTIWILVIAYTMRNIPLGFGAISPALVQIGSDLDRCARTVGADWWTTCRAILARLLAPAMFSCFVLLFVAFFKEYSTAVFLFASGSEVIGTTMLALYANGRMGPVSALCCLQVLVIAAIMVSAKRALRLNSGG